MHILTLVVAGLGLLAVFYGAARQAAFGFRRVLPVYLALWLVAALVNMWVGVTRAGYTVGQEALVLIPVFGIPALAALFLAGRSGG